MAATIDKLFAAKMMKAKMASKEKPHFFALVLKGGTSGKLLLDRKKIPMSKIGPVKKATGGTAVVIGVCYFDKQAGALIFETTKPPGGTWAKLVKDLARKEAGLTVNAKFIQAKRNLEEIKEPEDDKDDEAAEQEASQPEEGDAGQEASQPEEGDAEQAAQNEALEKWNLRFHAVKTELQEAAKAGKPWAKELWLKLSEAGTIYRQGKTVQAVTMCNEVVEAIKKFAAGPAGAGGEQAAAASKAQAGSAPPKGPAGPSATTGPTTAARASRNPETLFNERLKALLPGIKAAAGTRAGDEAKSHATQAGAFAREGDFIQANSLLDQAQAALKTSAASTPTGKDQPSAATDAPPAGGLVKKRQFLADRWQRLPQEVRADLEKLKQTIAREMPSEDADGLIELVEDYLDDFYGEMKDAIDDDINSGDAQYKEAISTIRAFRTEIAGDPLIQHLKTNKLKAEVSVESILLDALAEVEQALAS
jgi:hypothetical protein